MDLIQQLDLKISDLWYVPFWQTKLFYAILFITVFLMLVGCFFWFWQRRKKLTPIQQVWLKLNSLNDQVGHLDSQKFYFDLLANLKQWIYLKYDLNLEAKTDVELLNTLKRGGVDIEFCDLIAEILNNSVTIRFAKRTVGHEMMQNDLRRSLEVLKYIQ